MAHTKAGGSTNLGRDSASKRLGVKKFGGQTVIPGNIIIRQRGTKFRPGPGTNLCKDDTICATRKGIVKFTAKKMSRFTGKLKQVKVVSVVEA
ncbi:MAG: 50S ribosomal protein L27 [Candidatus Kerfeldbacteria bacterium]